MEYNTDYTYNLIKNSFEKMPSKAPEVIWENIDKQLYVDRVWFKLKSDLDHFETSKIKTRQLVNYAALILLFIIAGSTFYLLFNVEGKIQYSYKLKRDSCFKTYNQINNSPKILFNQSIIASVNDELSKKPNEREINANLNKIKNTQYNEVISSNENTNSIIEISTNDSLAVLCNKASKYYIDSLQKLIPLQIQLLNYPSENQTIPLRYPEFSNDTLGYNSLPETFNHQLGIIYTLNNTMLINNEYLDGRREGSNVNLIPSFASGYGLSYNYNLSRSNSISSEIYLISNQNQYMNLYSNGRYYKKNIEMVYSKIVLSYQRNIQLKNMNPGSRYFVRLGPYYSILSQKKVFYTRNSEIIDLPETSLSKNDYGVKLSFGWETEIKRIVIGGGLQSEYGIKNLFTGNENVPSDFNRTNNFSYGLFLTLKYKY